MNKNQVYDHWEFEQKGKDFQVHVRGNLVLNDPFMILKSTQDGLGATYMMENAITDQIKSGKLEVVLSQFAATSSGFYLYYPATSQVQPKLRAFVDHIKEKSKAGNYSI